MLGGYPTDPRLQQLWCHAALDVERYRTEHNITDQRDALGASPREPDAHQAWRAANDQIRWAVRSLSPPVPEPRIERGVDLGIEL